MPRTSLESYRNYEASNSPLGVAQPYVDNGTQLDPSFVFPLHGMYAHPILPFQNYPSAGLDDGATIYPYGPLDFNGHEVLSSMQPSAQALPTYSSSGYSTQDWPEYTFSGLEGKSAPPTPDFLPIQYPPSSSVAWEEFDNAQGSPLSQTKSKELVGMGLYDSPDSNSLAMSTFPGAYGLGQYHSVLQSRHGSVGKGLKLEETWQPPDDADGENDPDDDEAYSTDEGEEKSHNRFDSSPTTQDSNNVREEFSNSTFFYDNEDRYPRNLAYDQDMSTFGYSALEAGMEDTNWL